jgi:uncharacterized membrane protein YkvA (DUF1232 family)
MSARSDLRDLPGFPAQALGYFRDPAVATWRKLLGLGALLYTAWPIDAVPDFIPWLGWLDDVGILGFAAAWMAREIRRHARRSPIRP